MKIGIVTIHTAYNYGAMLQAFATQKVLTQMGHDVRFIDLYTKKQEKLNNGWPLTFNLKSMALFVYLSVNYKQRLRLKRFGKFRENFNLTKRYFGKNEIYSSLPKFDIYISGSDQIWNLENGANTFNFLDFVDGFKCKKISYASSFGTSKIPSEYKKHLAELLADYTAISVREDDGVEIIRDASGMEVTQVLDPTLLMSNAEWSEYVSDCKKLDYEYILIYALNNTAESVAMLESVRKRYKLPVVGIPMGTKVPVKFNVDREIKDAGPFEFVSLFENAKVVCTSSFHGLAFSLIFGKTFYVVPHPTRNSRLNSILKSLDLEKRQTYSPLEIHDMADSELFMDYSKTDNKLNEIRELSMCYLRENCC